MKPLTRSSGRVLEAGHPPPHPVPQGAFAFVLIFFSSFHISVRYKNRYCYIFSRHKPFSIPRSRPSSHLPARISTQYGPHLIPLLSLPPPPLHLHYLHRQRHCHRHHSPPPHSRNPHSTHTSPANCTHSAPSARSTFLQHRTRRGPHGRRCSMVWTGCCASSPCGTSLAGS